MIQPALTAEEWALKQVQVAHMGASIDGYGAEWLEGDWTGKLSWADRRVAVGALCLGGYFTREHVVLLDEAACACSTVGEPENEVALEALRDLIAALLPPEGV